jgi:hypothetical protein
MPASCAGEVVGFEKSALTTLDFLCLNNRYSGSFWPSVAFYLSYPTTGIFKCVEIS